MLPGLSGLEVPRRLRAHRDTPVILLTARDAVADKVAGLDTGANDYVTKGLFSMEGKRFALIPAYEPDQHLTELCAELKRRGYVLVIVNDGSSGRCAEYFRQAAAYGTVLEHIDNLGKGAAIKTGLRHIASVAAEGDVVVTADADGQHHADDIDLVAGAAQFMREALVIDSRAFDGEVPLFPISTGKLEGFNNRIKVAKRIGYGYRDDAYFFSLIRYLSLPSLPSPLHNFP